MKLKFRNISLNPIIVLAVISITLSTCVAPEKMTTIASPMAATSLPVNPATTACPVTEPVWARHPADSAVQGTPAFGYYLVNQDQSIWASAWWWESEEFPLRAGESGNKVGWFRPAGETLEITGRRLDVNSPPLESHIHAATPHASNPAVCIFQAKDAGKSPHQLEKVCCHSSFESSLDRSILGQSKSIWWLWHGRHPGVHDLNLFDWLRFRVIPCYTALGFTQRTVTLEVMGRRTGKPIRVSLSRTDHLGRSYFVSLGGESAWVRNVRAAQGKATILSRRRTPVRLVETAPEERAPILLAYVQARAFTHSGAQSSRHFFGLGPHPTLEQMEAIARRYIVFEIISTTVSGIKGK